MLTQVRIDCLIVDSSCWKGERLLLVVRYQMMIDHVMWIVRLIVAIVNCIVIVVSFVTIAIVWY